MCVCVHFPVFISHSVVRYIRIPVEPAVLAWDSLSGANRVRQPNSLRVHFLSVEFNFENLAEEACGKRESTDPRWSKWCVSAHTWVAQIKVLNKVKIQKCLRETVKVLLQVVNFFFKFYRIRTLATLDQRVPVGRVNPGPANRIVRLIVNHRNNLSLISIKSISETSSLLKQWPLRHTHVCSDRRN